MKLSENLSLAEVTKSQTAIRKGIDNLPTKEHLDNLIALANNLFEPLRSYIGKPLFISSGYRSEQLNIAINGSKTSQHSKGQAIDIDGDINGINNKYIFDVILNELDFDQLIWEFGDEEKPDWVHVSYNKTNNRKEVLRAFRDEDGKTHYCYFDLY